MGAAITPAWGLPFCFVALLRISDCMDIGLPFCFTAFGSATDFFIYGLSDMWPANFALDLTDLLKSARGPRTCFTGAFIPSAPLPGILEDRMHMAREKPTLASVLEQTGKKTSKSVSRKPVLVSALIFTTGGTQATGNPEQLAAFMRQMLNMVSTGTAVSFFVWKTDP